MPAPPATASPKGAVTIRGLAPELKTRLRVRAAHSARSMEAEARAILEAALTAPDEEPTNLAAFARGLFAPLGGVELELPPREPAREPPSFAGTAGEDVPPDAAAPGAARSGKGRSRTTLAGKRGPSPAKGGRR